jgi:speckle-type POZ protein
MKEMIPNGRGTWAAVSWPYGSTNIDPQGSWTYQNRLAEQKKRILLQSMNFNCSYDDNIEATYQLILEVEDTNFAKGERQVLAHLSKLLDTQSMADVTFIVKNERIGAHSAIVVSGSPVICAMLEEDKFKEGRTKEVEIEDIEPSVFKEMLRYLYTGRAPKLDEDDMTEPLFLAADKYQIEALKDLCEQSLISKLDDLSIVHYLVLAHLHSAPQLLEESLMFMEEHKKEVKARPEWK